MNFTVLGDYNNQITEEDGDYFVNICIPENEYDMDDIIEIFEKFNCFDESQILCGKTEESNCQMLCKWHNGHKSDN